MLGLDIDRKLVIAEHFARRWTYGGHDHSPQRLAQLRLQAKLLSHPQQVGNLVGAGDDQHIPLAGDNRPNVVL